VWNTHLRPKSDFCYRQTVAGLLMWGALSDKRTGLLFTITAGPCQHSHFRVQAPWDSWSYFTVSDLRLSQPGEPGPCIYIPQEQGGLIIRPGTVFPFQSNFCCSWLPLKLLNMSVWFLKTIWKSSLLRITQKCWQFYMCVVLHPWYWNCPFEVLIVMVMSRSVL
jgi:hypothetical protein